jgi:predicted dehydrogenase
MREAATPGKVRYAVVGLGYIAQVAVLPAFANARRNSELVALVSDDPIKRAKLAKRHSVRLLYAYDQFAECLSSGAIDAVYIALPNHLHRDYAVAAAKAGIHVLCEKPLAVTERECEEMIESAEAHGVCLMTAYRLHFEKANLKAIEIARSGKLGDVRSFHSSFTMQVKDGNIRLNGSGLGGGPLYDIGIYCINAARSVFGAEPTEVLALTANGSDTRFHEVDGTAAAILRFPEDRLASFVCSFGMADTGWYQVVGTKGDLCVDPAYEFAEALNHCVTIGKRTREATYPKRDQFAPELLYFSDCILKETVPEPSGVEGLADVRVIRALQRSAETGSSVTLEKFDRDRHPTMAQELKRPAVPRPTLVRAKAPSAG